MATKKAAKVVAPRFVKWIDDVGAAKIAGLLDVTRYAVYGWRRYAAGEPNGYRPDPSRLGAIVQLSGGALTSADIYPPKK